MPGAAARWSAFAALPVMFSCAVNPATGNRELALIGEGQEIQMGREYDGEVTASMGLVADTALQGYLNGLGSRLAAVTERPDLPWSFKVVDDPVVNAFAVPGGFIYITRGILASFESEAELAGVVGHEIGHVTARHSVSQMSRQQLQQLGLGVGMILSEDVRNYADLLGMGLGVLNLKYSRGDENQADELGVRYMGRLGYDPEAMVGVMDMLASVSGSGDGRVPEWQLTHPYPENREAHIRSLIQALPDTARLDAGRDRYLDRIHGLAYGENPREGYFKGSLFLHPDLAFQLRFPEGWKTVNQKSAVGAVGPGEQALVVLELVPGASDPATALRAYLSQEGVQGGQIRESRADGMVRAQAPFSATTSKGATMRAEVLFVSYRGALYRIQAVASATAWDAVASAATASLGSFAAVTDTRVLGVRPWTLQVVRLTQQMTLQQFYQSNPMPIPLAEAARLNRRSAADMVPRGTRLKRVVGEPLP
ncbi:MAG TPA: M48 family metalloprotease [Longimicrobiales bacterium]|nr:M48 family metalloprotease [Longimicrobiales bacterium]